jgi:hypothetical protein
MTLCPLYSDGNVSGAQREYVHLLPRFPAAMPCLPTATSSIDRNQRLTTIKPQYIISLVSKANTQNLLNQMFRNFRKAGKKLLELCGILLSNITYSQILYTSLSTFQHKFLTEMM